MWSCDGLCCLFWKAWTHRMLWGELFGWDFRCSLTGSLNIGDVLNHCGMVVKLKLGQSCSQHGESCSSSTLCSVDVGCDGVFMSRCLGWAYFLSTSCQLVNGRGRGIHSTRHWMIGFRWHLLEEIIKSVFVQKERNKNCVANSTSTTTYTKLFHWTEAMVLSSVPFLNPSDLDLQIKWKHKGKHGNADLLTQVLAHLPKVRRKRPFGGWKTKPGCASASAPTHPAEGAAEAALHMRVFKKASRVDKCVQSITPSATGTYRKQMCTKDGEANLKHCSFCFISTSQQY